NGQTEHVFAAERSTLDAAFERVAWVRPSEKDQAIVQFEMSSMAAWEQPINARAVVGGGSVRGNILHKLMEELLTGELQVSTQAAHERATHLICQLGTVDGPPGLDAQELAGTA